MTEIRYRRVRLLVVGAGPHALTVLHYLAGAPIDAEDVLVVDPLPWLAAWRSRFAAHEIPMLRSGSVHHPHPYPFELRDFARERGRVEFFDSIDRPSTPLFDDFCDHLLDASGLRERHLAARVRRLASTPEGVEAVLSDGMRVHADDAIVATNPTRPLIPAWAVAEGLTRSMPCRDGGRVVLGHGDHVTLADDAAPGQRILIIGGGLTAAQLALGGVRRHAQVTLVTRSPVRTRDLDVDAGWLGRDLRAFHRETVARRRSLLARARGGGSLPRREVEQIRNLHARQRLRLCERARVTEVVRRGETWRIRLDDGLPQSFDAVWLATGHTLDPRDAGPLTPLLRRTGSGRGPALLAPDLRVPETRVHVTGGLAALTVGPVCRTIIGARIAGERLARAFGAHDPPHQYPAPTTSHPR